MSDLERAFSAIKNKRPEYKELWDYYDGDHPLVYSASRLREVFKGLDAHFSENWAAVVIDAILERMTLNSLVIDGQPEDSQDLMKLWRNMEMHLDADDAHLAALVCGEAFIHVWPSDRDGKPEAYYNDPRLCHVFYDEENPREPSFAAKWWVDGQKRHRIVLYYRDRLEYYATGPGRTTSPSQADAFMLEDEAENPYSVIPIFHLRPERRQTKSALDNVIPIQAAINKLLSDMMVSAEFGAFRQRWIISNSDTSTLKNAPNEIWELAAGDGASQDTQVGEFEQTDLGNYINAIDSLISAVSAITRTPAHYFFHKGQVPSGEALIALEAPLNKKVKRYIERFRVTWRKAAAFLMLIAGNDLQASQIDALYAPPETVQPKTQAEIRQANVSAGIPLVTTVRREGWSEKQIEQMRQDRIQEQADAQQSLARALIEQQREFDQGESS